MRRVLHLLMLVPLCRRQRGGLQEFGKTLKDPDSKADPSSNLPTNAE